MGSVVAYWNAVCCDRSVRSAMTAYLFELAELSEVRLSDVPVTRPAFLDAIAESRRVKETGEQNSIQLFDGQLTGRILIAPELCNRDDLVSSHVVQSDD